jgi:outer membrane protein assembly factor BamC
VRYIDPQADNKKADKGGGWLSSLKFWGSSSDPIKAEQYRIEVKDVPRGSEVKVLNKEGSQENSATAGRILALLYEQLR